ncbi:hypothetical protein [Urechidicola vernalis]|uniref:MORN repeat variant n=1 Tax=Urechidicola vernalis TaxID=3075600 RepID=A0ABU2Y4G3_9FLAO|nr:hypothetical protein [Urechidicola sp. P050]MDT0553040.1 hypothetical protein [Urechidicola sp. P050]
MKQKITLLFLLFTILLFSQDVEKMQDSTGIGESTFYVLKSDMTTKHGEYSVKAYSGNTILISGMYSNGKKVGQWTERYYRKVRNLKSMGNYVNDLQVGKWVYYNSEGEIIQEYDFDKNELITSTECVSKTKYEVYLNGELTRSTLDCPASYIGGKQILIDELLKKITESFDFDSNEKERTNIKFDNLVSFFIDKNGNLENIQFLDKIEIPKLEEFIEKQLVERKGKWIVGELNGEKVKSNLDLRLSVNIMF